MANVTAAAAVIIMLASAPTVIISDRNPRGGGARDGKAAGSLARTNAYADD